ncbi:hypothetical protein VK70_12500 [Paenibacillus durus ATCC 35681]|uniref:Uncharacterized protein n=1 Tax=Paenibacillus durus ATCC 35681 TaxID=1333534 RepID=A0A0F7FGF7_PAEDU|nr:hypothetical protein VK70_12500 [Paenibacillus durus ATCC 35681]
MLTQDERMKSFDKQTLNHDELRKWAKASENPKESIFSLYVDGDCEYKDWMDRPIPMVSDELKNIFEIYQPNINWKLVVLANVRQLTQKLYWVPKLNQVDCLSQQSEWHKNGILKKMVIDREAIRTYKICNVRGSLAQETIVDLDVAECLLKFNMSGFRLQQVETEQSR